MATQPQTEIYTIELPDGSQVDVEGPAGANEQELHTFLQSQGVQLGGAPAQQPAAANDAAPAPPATPAPQPEQVDRSAPIAMADTSPGTAVLSTENKTVTSPYLQRYGDQLGRMVAAGVPDAEIQDFLKQTGAPADQLNIGEALAFRHTPQFREWKRQNPGKPYPFNPEITVPLTADEKAGAELRAQPLVNALGTAAAGAADTASLGLFDEAAGLADPEFRQKRDLAADYNRLAYTLGQIGGGLGFPSGAMEAGAVAARAAIRQGLGREAAKAAARRAIIAQSAKEGAAYGGAYGAGSADGDLADRAADGVVGALTGGLAGAAVAGIGTRLAARAERASAELTPQQQAGQAAERLGMDMLPADAGGPMTRRATSMAAQTIAGGAPIINAAQRVNEQAQGARDRIASAIGDILRPEAAGQQAIAGAKSYINSSRNEARRFYAAAENATKGFRADPVKALETLDQNIAELAQTPGGDAALNTLQSIRNDLAAGKTTVTGIRAMRTAMRDRFAESGLRGSDIERRVNQVIDAAAEDVTDSLNAAGKGDAARAFQSGDRAWKERAQTIDNVIQPIIGKRDAPKSGEQVVKTLMADLQGNNARAVKFLRTLPPDEANNVRASIIGAMGRSSKGAQNADGDAFSLPQFLTHWNDIGESAKAAYFGPEARAALNDLATIAEQTKAAQGYANRSNTGGAVGNLLTLGTAAGGIPAFVATTAAQYGLGRLLASPRFARWLARAPKTQLSGPAYVDRLSRIAAAEPAIAADILGLQKRLADAFSGSAPMRAAADEAGNGSLGIPQQQGDQGQNNPQELPQ